MQSCQTIYTTFIGTFIPWKFDQQKFDQSLKSMLASMVFIFTDDGKTTFEPS